MKDDNFMRETNGHHIWQPMGHPGDAQRTPPRIIKSAEGVRLSDIDVIPGARDAGVSTV